MGITAYEGIVEKGRVKLKNNFLLPNETEVYVVVPSVENAPEPPRFGTTVIFRGFHPMKLHVAVRFQLKLFLRRSPFVRRTGE